MDHREQWKELVAGLLEKLWTMNRPTWRSFVE